MQRQIRMVSIENCQHFKDIKELKQSRVILFQMFLRNHDLLMMKYEIHFIYCKCYVQMFSKRLSFRIGLPPKLSVLQKKNKLTTVIKSTENIYTAVSICINSYSCQHSENFSTDQNIFYTSRGVLEFLQTDCGFCLSYFLVPCTVV